MSAAPCIRTADGTALPLPLERWLGPVTPAEERLLDRVIPPALDVGCGPGRLVLALAQRGMVALGVDAAPTAVGIAWDRGALVLERSIFERVPGSGRWGTALLIDGNVGIGGDPEALLVRLRGLLRPGGRILVELDPPGASTGRTWLRIEAGSQASHPFPWARVGIDDLPGLARRTGFRAIDVWSDEQRWFGVLDLP